MRERLSIKEDTGQGMRITPARAGKTFMTASKNDIFQDHPRSCGKDGRRLKAFMAEDGSPPLVRERLRYCDIATAAFRITPARAGKTRISKRPGRTKRDHPRSCGKDFGIAILRRLPLGSPPLVRERHELASGLEERNGITPARAGKTSVVSIGGCSSEDHPRSCGKDKPLNYLLYLKGGSPPLVRERRRRFPPQR